MDVTSQISLNFMGVDFPNVILNAVNPNTLNSKENSIKINIVPKVFYPKEENALNYFKIIQDISIEAEERFELYITAVGTFEIKGNVDEKIKKSFVNTNAPAIMFPYVRSFITTLTANLGNVTGVLVIPAQFFSGELEEYIMPEN